MLSEEICKKCVTQNTPKNSWNRQDERNWDEDGIVDCPAALGSGWARTKDGPPKKCCYFTEQFLYHDATKEEVKC